MDMKMLTGAAIMLVVGSFIILLGGYYINSEDMNEAPVKSITLSAEDFQGLKHHIGLLEERIRALEAALKANERNDNEQSLRIKALDSDIQLFREKIGDNNIFRNVSE